MGSRAVAPVDRPFNTYTAAQAERIVNSAMKKKIGFMRDPRPNLPKTQPLYIFNVSDKELTWSQPGFGFYVVPACGPDEEYSKPIYQLGKENEPGIEGLVCYEFLEIDKTKWAFHNAEELGAEILRIGPGKPPEQNLELRGYFRSWSNPPKPSEVKAARDKFFGTLEAIVKDGNYIHSQGEKKGPDGQMLSSEHIWAAKILGQQEPWARGARQMVQCPSCKYDMPANASVHFGQGGCGAVIDPDRAFEDGLIDEKKFKQVVEARNRKKEQVQ